jgi:DnaJ-class molecular chaperone
MGLPDLYRILEVRPDAGPDEIQAAWKRACFRYHPDSAGESADPRRLHVARKAYRLLSDPSSRARYDRLREASRRAANPPILSTENIRGNYRFLRRGMVRLSRALWRRFGGS